MSINRRTFIAGALALVSSPQAAQAVVSRLASASAVDNVAGGVGQRLSASGSLPASASPGALLAALSDPTAAGWLGRRYLSELPQDQDTNRLIDQLSTAIALHQGRVPVHSPELQKALVSLIQYEYVAAPLLTVDGWLLAPSEARLYALAALATTSQQALDPMSPPTKPPTSRLIAGS
ncbi:hypothetical protein [Halochromatium sp.]